MSETDSTIPPPPLRFGRRHVLAGAAMLAASGLAVARLPKAHAAPIAKDRFQSWIPDVVGTWRFSTASGVVLPPPDALSERTYDNLVTRVYEAPGATPMMLLIAYNNIQDGVLQVHRPEICYPVGGYALTPTRPHRLDLAGQAVPANVFSAVGSERTEQVLYWTRVGDAFPGSWAQQRLAVARANVAGRIPDGMMMRVSVVSDRMASVLPQMDDFARQFVAAGAAPLRRLLVGAPT